ncbi:MAG TPA: methyltransferase [Nannocystaceae bacterium]|nr:methyltransferase [Nannocystaceae bacterium]
MTEGLRTDDPGMVLLARAVAHADPRGVLLCGGGELSGLAGATRLVTDVRELADGRSRALGITDAAAIDALPPMQHAIVWPRAHLGKDFTQLCLARGALALAEGGRLSCAVRKHKGAESVADFMAALLGNVETKARDSGYRLLESVHEGTRDDVLARATIERRYVVSDPRLDGLELASAPGVFSRRELDAGTAALIDHVAAWAEARTFAPASAIDLCAGIGPLGLWAARRWPALEVLAVDSNMIAIDLLHANVESAGLAARVTPVLADGLPGDPPAVWAARRGTVELALVNPPTHAERGELGTLLAGLRGWMAADAPVFVVVSRAGTARDALRAAGADVRETMVPGYTVLEAYW